VDKVEFRSAFSLKQKKVLD